MAKKKNDLMMPTLVAILAVIGLIAISQFFSGVNDGSLTSAAQSDLRDFSEDCYEDGYVIEEIVENNVIRFECKNIEDVGLG